MVGDARGVLVDELVAHIPLHVVGIAVQQHDRVDVLHGDEDVSDLPIGELLRLLLLLNDRDGVEMQRLVAFGHARLDGMPGWQACNAG